MKRAHLIVLLAVCLFCVTSVCEAFDGNRKGFVVGVGTGVAPLVRWSSSSGADQTKIGGALNFLIGYGWDNKNVLAFEANRAITVHKKGNGSVWLYSNGISGINWYHFFAEKYTSWYSMFGVGSFFSADADYDVVSELGFIAGAGFGLNKSFKTGLYVSGSRSHQGPDNQFTVTCYQVSLIIDYMAF